MSRSASESKIRELNRQLEKDVVVELFERAAEEIRQTEVLAVRVWNQIVENVESGDNA